MGERYTEINEKQQGFIKKQHLFFVGTATADSRINISPKGMDSFRVLDKNRVLWLNVTGSGNETAAHMQSDERMTIMFCAFEGAPNILRLYGHAKTIQPGDADWQTLYEKFTPLAGARQIFDMHVDLVQTSCGFGVPLLDYKEDRETLARWADKKGEDGVREYWLGKNGTSLDGETIYLPKEKE